MKYNKKTMFKIFIFLIGTLTKWDTHQEDNEINSEKKWNGMNAYNM
jgi:hypothetical protein